MQVVLKHRQSSSYLYNVGTEQGMENLSKAVKRTKSVCESAIRDYIQFRRQNMAYGQGVIS